MKQNGERRKKRSQALAIGVMAIMISQLFLYLGTRTLERELEQIFVHPFQAE